MDSKDKIELLKLAYEIMCDEEFIHFHYMNGKLERTYPIKDFTELCIVFSKLKKVLNENYTER